MGIKAFALELENYTFCNVSCWGVAYHHLSKYHESDLSSTEKYVHLTIAIIEGIPVIGQIASIFEAAIVLLGELFASDEIQQKPDASQSPASRRNSVSSLRDVVDLTAQNQGQSNATEPSRSPSAAAEVASDFPNPSAAAPLPAEPPVSDSAFLGSVGSASGLVEPPPQEATPVTLAALPEEPLVSDLAFLGGVGFASELVGPSFVPSAAMVPIPAQAGQLATDSATTFSSAAFYDTLRRNQAKQQKLSQPAPVPAPIPSELRDPSVCFTLSRIHQVVVVLKDIKGVELKPDALMFGSHHLPLIDHTVEAFGNRILRELTELDPSDYKPVIYRKIGREEIQLIPSRIIKRYMPLDEWSLPNFKCVFERIR